MSTNILATAVALSDRDLLARIPVLAANERTATGELVAHLAALRLRPSLYAAQGYGSLFAYCREALRLSEDAASNRIHAARACLKFPVILDRLASGELSLSAVRMLRPHLTMENHEEVLARARNARKVDIQRLVAELAPRPDVPPSVRRLPVPSTSQSPPAVAGQALQLGSAAVVEASSATRLMFEPEPTPVADACATEDRVEVGTLRVQAGDAVQSRSAGNDAGECQPDVEATRGGSADVQAARGCSDGLDAGHATSGRMRRPIIEPLAPGRYRVQFTIGEEGYDILRQLQTLLRREIPDGDAGVIFERALRAFHEKVQAVKFGAAHNRIRPGADPAHPDAAHSRYIPKAVKRAVWYRDRGQCAFVAPSGQRCVEREFLELHHIQPYAWKGSATEANIALRCRVHNAYEAEVVFGTRAASALRRNISAPG